MKEVSVDNLQTTRDPETDSSPSDGQMFNQWYNSSERVGWVAHLAANYDFTTGEDVQNAVNHFLDNNGGDIAPIEDIFIPTEII